MASWLGYTTTNWTSSPNTISVPLRSPSSSSPATNGSTNGSTNATPLLQLCQSLTPPCHLNPFLPGGHIQTIYAVATKRNMALLHYKRRVFTSNSELYPGCFAVDFVSRTPAATDLRTISKRTTEFAEAEWERFVQGGSVDGSEGAEEQEEVKKRPFIVALHGLSGGSHEDYLREVLDPLISGTPVGAGGSGARKWDALVVNARGCANSPVTGDRLFNARATWDVRQVVQWVADTFPGRSIFGIGFSMGGNILTDYLGEEGVNTPMSAAVIASNPWNLEVGNVALRRTWIGREVYSKSLAQNLQKLFEKHVKAIGTNPRIDIEKVRACKYLHEFDRELQAPLWGYPTEGAYYRDASSVEPLLAVRVPIFAIHADDDPVAPTEVQPYEEAKCNPYVVLCSTSMGGHLSWFEYSGERWFIKPTVNFLRKMADDVDLQGLRNQAESDEVAKSAIKSTEPFFDPVRRKLHTPLPGRV